MKTEEDIEEELKNEIVGCIINMIVFIVAVGIIFGGYLFLQGLKND